MARTLELADLLLDLRRLGATACLARIMARSFCVRIAPSAHRLGERERRRRLCCVGCRRWRRRRAGTCKRERSQDRSPWHAVQECSERATLAILETF
jgi:hypothetical protein